ncbi:Ileal sodium/bile acid cotransporter [Seminavis robusta]|uniref:Ileal sodium/bile acid cotransporter n=1 Tax=Seminavis robusta TaxID=568900 RepID=A0A9N8H271_9STRA|nr:Ileal sodium/bile acid cotransporter [Seminavis robusta]|eukprot:Sro4_g003800.1 Ileal sodium/bile acid cotransporter (405) ;mRNA; f:246500-247939
MGSSVSDTLTSLISNVLVFCLVFGMSGTVDVRCFKAQLQNAKAVMTGLLLQFLLMPFLGFVVVKSLDMDYITGLMILAVTCSPGGSYSNWWCSMFNADLALSVTMTAISTCVSVIMLPFNLYVHARLTYGEEIIDKVDWGSLYMSIVVVIFAIGAGFIASFYSSDPKFNLNANRLGNAAGALLILFSVIVSNSHEDYTLWNRDWSFYFGVAIPCLFGLVFSTAITTCLLLLAPERVTVSIECAFQNVGIAMSIAAAMFDGDDLSQAIGVPVYYGFIEALFVSMYCVWAWQAGWTKAPTDISLWKALTTSYEVYTLDQALNSTTTGNVQLPRISPPTQENKNIPNGTNEGDWDCVDYGDDDDAPSKEPKTRYIDYEEQKKKKAKKKKSEKKETSSVGNWFGGFLS